MEKEIINALAPAAVEVAKRTYDDVAHRALSQVGEMAEGIMKFVALPFKFLGMTAEQLIKKYDSFIKGAINRVPEDKRIMPEARIVAPLMDYVKFVFDDITLEEMFSQLLSASIDSELTKFVHPSFVHVLTQMSSKDAKFFKLVYRHDKLVLLSSLSVYSRIRFGQYRTNNTCIVGFAAEWADKLDASWAEEELFNTKECHEYITFCEKNGLMKQIEMQSLDKREYAIQLLKFKDDFEYNIHPSILMNAQRKVLKEVKENESIISLLQKEPYKNINARTPLFRSFWLWEIPHIEKIVDDELVPLYNLTKEEQQQLLMDFDCERSAFEISTFGEKFAICCGIKENNEFNFCQQEIEDLFDCVVDV